MQVIEDSRSLVLAETATPYFAKHLAVVKLSTIIVPGWHIYIELSFYVYNLSPSVKPHPFIVIRLPPRKPLFGDIESKIMGIFKIPALTDIDTIGVPDNPNLIYFTKYLPEPLGSLSIYTDNEELLT